MVLRIFACLLIPLLGMACATGPVVPPPRPFQIRADGPEASPYVVRWGKLFDGDARAASPDDIVVDWVTCRLEPGPGLVVEVHGLESRPGSDLDELVLWFLIDDRSRPEGAVSRILAWDNAAWMELKDEPIHEIRPRVPVTYSYHRGTGRLVLRVKGEIAIPGSWAGTSYTIRGELEVTDPFPEHRYYRAFMQTLDPRPGFVSEDELLAVVRADGTHEPYWFRAVKLLCDSGSEEAVVAVAVHLGSLEGLRFQDAFSYVVDACDRLRGESLRRAVQDLAGSRTDRDVLDMMPVLGGHAVASHAVAAMIESDDRDLVMTTAIWLLRRGPEGLGLDEDGWERILLAVDRAEPELRDDPALWQLFWSLTNDKRLR